LKTQKFSFVLLEIKVRLCSGDWILKSSCSKIEILLSLKASSHSTSLLLTLLLTKAPLTIRTLSYLERQMDQWQHMTPKRMNLCKSATEDGPLVGNLETFHAKINQ
jgi:hypothetical protein